MIKRSAYSQSGAGPGYESPVYHARPAGERPFRGDPRLRRNYGASRRRSPYPDPRWRVENRDPSQVQYYRLENRLENRRD